MAKQIIPLRASAWALLVIVAFQVSEVSAAPALRRALGKKSKSRSSGDRNIENPVRGESRSSQSQSLHAMSNAGDKKGKSSVGGDGFEYDDDDEHIPDLAELEDSDTSEESIFNLLEAQETVRVVVQCSKKSKKKKGDKDKSYPNLPQDQCLEKILDVGLDPPVEVIHDLSFVHRLAIRLHIRQLEILKMALPTLSIVTDPDRTPQEIVMDNNGWDDEFREDSNFSKTKSRPNENLQNRRAEAERQLFPAVQSWPGQKVTRGVHLIGAPFVHREFGVTGEKVTVCILDTGFSGHPDFRSGKIDGSSALVDHWDNDGTGHGTFCSGIIAADDNDFGVMGVAPGVNLFVVRVFNENRRFYGSDVIRAIGECKAGGASIVNMSFGGSRSSEAEHAALANENDMLFIAAAGNTGNKGNTPHYPAKYSSANVISVASIDADGNHALFSTFNDGVDIAAPGTGIISTGFDPQTKTNLYQTKRGTSMSAPHVAGVAALLKSRHPSATPQDLRNAMLSTAYKKSEGHDATKLGAGMVDAVAAIEFLDSVMEDRELPTAPDDGADGLEDEDEEESKDMISIKVLLKFDDPTDVKYKLKEKGKPEKLLSYDYGVITHGVLHSRSVEVEKEKCYRFVIAVKDGNGFPGVGNGLSIFYAGNHVKSYKNIGRGGKRYIGNC